MPRTNWKGVISFGLVTIPIILVPSKNRSADISFHQIDKKDNSRIKYQRVNANTGKHVPWEQIIKGYEYEKDQVVPVPDEILKKVAGEKDRAIHIENFINKNQFDFLFIENVYYLAPDKRGEKGYVILRESLESTNKIGIAKVILSTKEHLAALMPHDKGLLLCLLKYDNELNKLEDLNLPDKEISSYKVTKKEIEVAKQLIQSMTTKWRPEQYKDEYQAAIHQWIEETVNHLPHHTSRKKASKPTATVVNFVDLLKQSLKSHSKTSNAAKTNVAHHRSVAKLKKHARHATKH